LQEEVENKTVHLAIQSSKVTVKTLLKGLHAWYRHHQRKKDVAKMSGETVRGKQSVKELIGQGQGVSSMDIGDSGIKDFKKIANKYGVDFAIVKDKEADPPRFTVFFKAKDADAITQILKDYAAKQTKKKERTAKPSILQKLKKFKEIVASMPRRDKERRKEREL
jgi:phosphoribosylformylglycinamidine (FGAM) synthase-like enzyme